MKVMVRAVLLALFVALLFPTHASALEMNLKNSIIIGSLGVGVLGITKGVIKSGDADDLYDDYLAAKGALASAAVYAEHEEMIDSANTWMAVGYCGLGLGVGTYLLDKFYLSKRDSVALYMDYRGNGPKLAMTLKY